MRYSYKKGRVKLEVLVTKFSNPQNKNAFNQCCDGNKGAPTCTDSCDLFFVVCDQDQQCQKAPVVLRNSSEVTFSQGRFRSSVRKTLGNYISTTLDTYSGVRGFHFKSVMRE